MNNQEKPLLQPIKIGNLTIKNRVAMAPMNMNYTDPGNFVSKQQCAYYAARAMGGTGMIIVEAMKGTGHEISNNYKKYNNLAIYNETYVPKLASFVEHVKSYGAKIIAQVSIGPGAQGTQDVDAVQPVAASPIRYRIVPSKLITGMGSPTNIKPTLALARTLGYQEKISTDPTKAFEQIVNVSGMHMVGEMPREITKEEIKELVNDYGYAAKCTKLAGFDGLEIHAPHGYLLHSFISPRLNQRTDEYGGSLDNRLRIIKESIDSMRKYVGPDFVIGVRMSASVEISGDITPEHTNEAAKKLASYGADFIHLSDGSYECMSDFLPNKDGQVISKAKIIKQGLTIPLICPSVHDPKLADEAVRNGDVDMISQGRQQIADPEWVNKYAEDRTEDIIRCTRCNEGCIKRFMVALPARCTVNPVVGHEEDIDIYAKRSLESLKSRQWQTIAQIGKEPSA